MRQAKVSPYLVGIFETFSKQFFIFRHLMFCHRCNLIKFKGSYSLKLKVNWLFLQGQQEYQLYATKWWKSHSELTRKVNLFQCSRAWDWYSYYGSIQILLDDNKELEKKHSMEPWLISNPVQRRRGRRRRRRRRRWTTLSSCFASFKPPLDPFFLCFFQVKIFGEMKQLPPHLSSQRRMKVTLLQSFDFYPGYDVTRHSRSRSRSLAQRKVWRLKKS